MRNYKNEALNELKYINMHDFAGVEDLVEHLENIIETEYTDINNDEMCEAEITRKRSEIWQAIDEGVTA